MLRDFLKRMDFLAALSAFAIAALICSQLSQFMQQYTQNLSGRLAEARREVDGIILRAGQADMPVYAYLHEFRSAENPVFQQQGVALRATIDRASGLEEAYRDLTQAGLVTKPFVFLRHADTGIAMTVLEQFKPAIPVDTAGLVYSGLGGVLGLCFYELVKALCRAPFRLRRLVRDPLQSDRSER